jgi:hypothetical protein
MKGRPEKERSSRDPRRRRGSKGRPAGRNRARPARSPQAAKALPPRVDIDGDQIRFREKVDELAVKQFRPAVSEAREQGRTGFTLNFYDVQRAYPDAMLQLITQVDRFRRQRLSFDVLTPEKRRLNRLFLNANWAHLLAPSMFSGSDTPSDRHLPARRYASGEEQKRIVDDTLEILLKAMREGHPRLRRDVDAIGEAIKQGVTRSPEHGQGNGLAGALRISTLSGGSFRVVSGCGELAARHPPDSPEYEQKVRGRPNRYALKGTCVTVELHTARGLDLDQALNFSGGHAGWDYIDAQYLGEHGEIRLPLAQETDGFGSRTAGRSMRIKALNLLRAESAARLILDWEGVPSVSSSFADEFLGRLFVELGPTVFMQRIESVAIDPLVGKLIDRAILQRSAQSL